VQLNLKSDRETDEKQDVELVLDHPVHTRLALKNGNHFLVLAENGMMPNEAGDGYGLYADDTRFLSRYEISVNGKLPRLLYSNTDEAFAARMVYGNAASDGLPEQRVLIIRELVIHDERLHERLTIRNVHPEPVSAALRLHLGADFFDMFEVRGSKRSARGRYHDAVLSRENSSVTFGYSGIDGKSMSTAVQFTGIVPDVLSQRAALFHLSLEQGQSVSLEITVSTKTEARGDLTHDVAIAPTLAEALAAARKDYLDWRSQGASISTSVAALNSVLERGYRDLYMLRQSTPRGACLAAGIPWFTVAFGRDQCVTALQTMPFLPDLTRDVIAVLAAYQAESDDDWRAMRTGKIMHELRLGEMARNREIPFIPYYGTVDATQLWLKLLCRYIEWTGDLKFARRLWKNVRAAVKFLANATTSNGYIAYGDTTSALANQGWKDSGDSVMYSDGVLAKAPISICEAQGYLYSAWDGLARLSQALGYVRQSRTFRRKAQTLQTNFRRDFWMPEKRFVALALDGSGKQCDVIASNPGHLLGCGILDTEMEQAVAERLGQPDMFCGWGIRTLSSNERRFNPVSYHNGSVWPHDNSLAMEGLCKTGHHTLAHQVLQGMLDAAKTKSDSRLPELFGGFSRKEWQDAPIRYQDSCVPQAWAAGSIFLMLASCLGIRVRGKDLHVERPSLPSWLESVSITGLRVGNAKVDLEYSHNFGGRTRFWVARKRQAV
jgi:glycogen debranching enzyme